MKKILYILLLMTTVSCQKNAFQSVDVQTFATIIQDTNVILVDVRTEAEYNQGHIAGAILIDAMQSDFVAQAKNQLPANSHVAIYCRSGRRSKQAAMTLAAEGYKVVELNTGYNSWK